MAALGCRDEVRATGQDQPVANSSKLSFEGLNESESCRVANSLSSSEDDWRQYCYKRLLCSEFRTRSLRAASGRARLSLIYLSEFPGPAMQAKGPMTPHLPPGPQRRQLPPPAPEGKLLPSSTQRGYW